MPTLVDTLNEAVQHHQQGRLDDAETLYQTIVRRDPAHANALHLLGVLKCQRGNAEGGIEYIRRAISSDDSAALFHLHLGIAHRSVGQFEEAIASLQRAVQLDPNYGDAYFQLGICHEKQGNLTSATNTFREAVRTQPEKSEFCFRLGSALAAEEKFAEAASHLKNAVRLQPDNDNYHNSLGSVLQKQGILTDATSEYQTAIRLRPDFGPYHFNLGNALREQDQLEQAIEEFTEAVRLSPEDLEARVNLGVTLKELGRLDEAVEYYDHLCETSPGLSAARFNRSLVLLQSGKLARGWDEYEWRWEQGRCPRDLPQPAWNGSSLAGKSIFLYAEQGIGDEIMFGSCLPEILDQAAHCTLECDRRLVPLFARSFPSAEVVAKRSVDDENRSVHTTDYQLPIGSLPRFLRRKLNDFPKRARYLLPDDSRLAHWRGRFAALGNGLKIGISWRGGKEADVRRKRSTKLEQWSSLLSIPGVHFVNLQYGDCHEELEQAAQSIPARIHDWDDTDHLANLDDLAAQIAALDLVISVDNATVHLAGALGRPVWALLPFASDWRWMRGRINTPWYPSVRLFRQPCPGNWPTLFEEIKAELLRVITENQADSRS